MNIANLFYLVNIKLGVIRVVKNHFGNRNNRFVGKDDFNYLCCKSQVYDLMIFVGLTNQKELKHDIPKWLQLGVLVKL